MILWLWSQSLSTPAPTWSLSVSTPCSMLHQCLLFLAPLVQHLLHAPQMNPPMNVGAPQFTVQVPYHHQSSRLPSSRSPSSFYPHSEEEDEYLLPEVRLHISFKVISQLDKAEDFRWLLPKELSLCDFLVEQIRSL
jgi:hypothetical protein